MLFSNFLPWKNEVVRKIVFLFFICGCASGLKDEKELGETPTQMKQKIEEIPVSAVPAVTAPSTPAPTSSSASSASSSSAAKTQTKTKGKAVVKEAPPIKEEPRKVPDGFVDFWPFAAGEKSTFVVRYGPLEGGKATIEVAP